MPNYLTNAGDEDTPEDIGTEILQNALTAPYTVNSPVAVGSKAIYCPRPGGHNSASARHWDWPSPVAVQVAEFRWRPAAATAYKSIAGPREGGDYAPWLVANSNGVLQLRSASNLAVVHYSSPDDTVQAGNYYKVKLVWNCSTNRIELWIDDAQLYGGDIDARATEVGGFQFGNLWSGYWNDGFDQYFDAIRVADGPFEGESAGFACKLAIS